jgi:hypothetical protein
MERKEMKIREKIENMVDDYADKKRWAFYKIQELLVILDDDGGLLFADVTVNFQDESGINEQLISKFSELTKKDFVTNIRIY